MDRAIALILFELYYQYGIDGTESGRELAGEVKNNLKKGNYHVEVDEIEGMYRLRHIVRAEGIDVLVAERAVFGETIIK